MLGLGGTVPPEILDLSLKGMPLNYLNLAGVPVSDLSAARGESHSLRRAGSGPAHARFRPDASRS